MLELPDSGSSHVMPIRSVHLSLLCSLAGIATAAMPAHAVDFEKQILPILKDNCIKCHGPEKQKSELPRRPARFTSSRRRLRHRRTRPPVTRKPATSSRSSMAATPKSSCRRKATRSPPTRSPSSEKWIADGAGWPGQMDEKAERTTDLWSFQPVTRPEVPTGAKKPRRRLPRGQTRCLGPTPPTHPPDHARSSAAPPSS